MSDEEQFNRPKWNPPELVDSNDNWVETDDDRQVGCLPTGTPCHPNCHPRLCHPGACHPHMHCYPMQSCYPLQVCYPSQTCMPTQGCPPTQVCYPSQTCYPIQACPPSQSCNPRFCRPRCHPSIMTNTTTPTPLSTHARPCKPAK